MKNNRGFSLIEVIISLGIFIYVLSALFSMLGVFNGNLLKQETSAKCTRTTITLLLKRLTNATRVSVGSATSSISSVYFEYLNGDMTNLKIINNKMYLTSGSISDLQFDTCEIERLDFDEKNKCLTLIYHASKTYTSSRSETVCALK